MRRAVGWVMIGLLLVAVLAGCSHGGDGDREATTTTTTAPEARDAGQPPRQDVDGYAGAMCTALDEWVGAVVAFQQAGLDAGGALAATAPDPAAVQAAAEGLDAEGLDAASQQAAAATADLVDALASIDPPVLDGGEGIHRALVAASRESTRSFEALRPQLEVAVTETDPSGLAGVRSEVERVGAELTSDAAAFLDDAPAELEAAFEANAVCLEVQEALAAASSEQPEPGPVTGPDPQGTSTATAPAASTGVPPGDPGGGRGAVEEFCAAVQDYVTAAQDDPNDPGLAAQAEELTAMSSGLGTSGLTDADVERIAACSQQLADALSG